MSAENDVLQQLVLLRQDVHILRQQIDDFQLFNKPVLSFAEFCRFASISEHTGRALTRSGKVPFTRPFDKKLYIDRETAIAVLLKNSVNSNAQIDEQAYTRLLTTKTAA